MGSNIIAHLIFFSLYTSYSLILNIPTTTHFEIYSNHCHMFGSSFNNTKFDLMYLKLHQCCWSVLTHWSQVWPYVSQVSTILFTFSHFTFCFSYLFLQNSLSLNEHVQEARATKKKPHYGCLRLYHFILERAISKSKPLFLNLKTRCIFQDRE